MANLKSVLENSYIKSTEKNLEFKKQYFLLCSLCGLHNENLYPLNLTSDGYQWPWIYEDGRGILQQAPEKRYIEGKNEITPQIINRIIVQLNSNRIETV